MKHFFLLSLSLCLGRSAWSQSAMQDSSKIIFVEPTIATGTIVNSNRKAQTLVRNNPILIQLDMGVVKNTASSWNYCNCYTQNGISLSYADFGNTKSLGKALSFSLFTKPYLINSNKISLFVRGAAGFSYLNKIYDAQADSNNIFFSKRISFMLQLGTGFYYRLTPSLRVGVTAQFNHISNGGTRWPNWGMNFPTAGLGVSYSLKPMHLTRREHKPLGDTSLKIVMHIFGGRNTADASKRWPEAKRLLTGINLGLIKPLGRISSIGGGGELYYDGIAKVEQARADRTYHSMIASLSLQHYLSIGKLWLGQQVAYYITALNPDVKHRVYQRYFIEYKVKGPLYAGVSLKAHGNISDNITFTTGYIFNSRSRK